MNKLIIIGNLTRDPELRTTSTGKTVCDFTVAVNRRQQKNAQNNQPEADFFRISAWNTTGENCAKYLKKGSKVCVVGPVTVRTYTGNDSQMHANLEVMADDVEFLSSSKDGAQATAPAPAPAAAPASGGFTKVDTDELPF